MIIIVGESAVGINMVVLSLTYLVNETIMMNKTTLHIYIPC